MKGNKRTNTKPEVQLRSALHALGLRFRKDFPVDAGGRKRRPDIVFTRQRVAVYVDGCFWHGCPDHGRVPGGRNAEYWSLKMARNKMRDTDDTEALTRCGWLVVRLWEHVAPKDAAETVVAALSERVCPPSSSV